MEKYKSAREVINETTPEKVGLALLYIETERQLFHHMHDENNAEIARCEGFMQGILSACRLLGIEDLYSKTISNLRFAIQEENKEYADKRKE